MIAFEAALGRWLDAAIVVVVLILNVLIGFVQTSRMQDAVAALRERMTTTARVLRDGHWTRVPAVDLVPGDVLHLRTGDVVPADVRIIEGTVLVDQSVLTGESVPLERGLDEETYSGSAIARGEATAEITATGIHTLFGRTAELVATSGSRAHLDLVVLRMVRVFIALDLLLAIVGTVFLRANGAPTRDVFGFAVVLLLASVPVALPAAFALAGALGAQHLAGLGILTVRLTALQEAAGMDVLCVDKTGTITQNRLAVVATVVRPGTTEDELLEWAATASEEATQDPIDLAILGAAAARGLQGHHDGFVPFDPATKRSEATIETGQGIRRVTKGAPQVLAAMAGEPPDLIVDELGSSGARVLAVGIAEPGDAWRLAGWIALADPPRPDAADVVRRLTELGVRVMMVTGDSASTAAAVAAQVGIPGPVRRAPEFRDWPDLQAGALAGVVAEVLPEDKHQLVRRLQDAGYVVGMTGDGVNDAPALRQADVGMAVCGATDVAKTAASMVFTREGLGVIVGLIEESRRSHQRSLSYALNVSVKKLELPVLLTVGVFAFREFVFTPLLMALLLLGNDVVSLTLAVDRADYSRRPDHWRVNSVVAGAFIIGVPLLAVSVSLLTVGQSVWGLDLGQLRTLAFVTLLTSSQVSIYLVRTRGHAWASAPDRAVLLATGSVLLVGVLLALTGTFMSALTLGTVVTALAGVLAGALVADLVKVRAFKALGLHRLWRAQAAT